jgi:hypothetical protein
MLGKKCSSTDGADNAAALPLKGALSAQITIPAGTAELYFFH